MHQSFLPMTAAAAVVDLARVLMPPAMINGGVVGLVLLGAAIPIVYVENRVVIGETAVGMLLLSITSQRRFERQLGILTLILRRCRHGLLHDGLFGHRGRHSSHRPRTTGLSIATRGQQKFLIGLTLANTVAS